MIKIAAQISKKVPLPGRQYSSQQFGASLELEIPDGQKPEEIQDRLRRLYAVLSRSVDEQVAAAGQQCNGNGENRPQPAPRSASAISAPRFVPATAAQQRAIYALCKRAGIGVEDALAQANLPALEKLGIKQASELIDRLKSQQPQGR